MARISFAAHPFLLGFEQIDRLLEKTIKSRNDGFPPYNIELSDDSHYKITLAARHFQKTFVLADGVEVSGASLQKGLLNVFLLRKNLEPKVKKIKINSDE